MRPVNDDGPDLAPGRRSKRERILGSLADMLRLRPDPYPYPDGFGQSLIQDIRFYVRSRKCRNIPVQWRYPHPNEAETWNSHPLVSRFADDLFALAQVDGRD